MFVDMRIKYSNSHEGTLNNRATNTCSGTDIQAVGYTYVENGVLAKETKYFKNDDEVCIVKPKSKILIKTGIKMELPKPTPVIQDGVTMGYMTMEAQARGRSGLSLKTHTQVILGTIDNEYRGEVGVIFENTGDEPFEIHKLDRIGQLVFQFVYVPIHGVGIINVPESELHLDTARNNGGFGHTGVGGDDVKWTITTY